MAPSDQRSFISRLLFLYTNYVFNTASIREITRKDMNLLAANNSASATLKRLKTILGPAKEKIPLWKALYTFQKKNLILSVIYRLLGDILMVTMPLIFRQFSRTLQQENPSIMVALILLFFIPILILA